MLLDSMQMHRCKASFVRVVQHFYPLVLFYFSVHAFLWYDFIWAQFFCCKFSFWFVVSLLVCYTKNSLPKNLQILKTVSLISVSEIISAVFLIQLAIHMLATKFKHLNTYLRSQNKLSGCHSNFPLKSTGLWWTRLLVLRTLYVQS